MDIVGFCTIKKDATTGKGTENPEWFLGKDCSVMEFDRWGGALVLDQEGRGMAMFDKQDISRKFECTVMGDYVMPPKLDLIQQMTYTSKVMSRKGGYNKLLKNMVIQASLMKGEFTDDFLFQKEREENIKMSRLSEKEQRILILEYELKNHRSYYTKSKPRRLRRILRRIKQS